MRNYDMTAILIVLSVVTVIFMLYAVIACLIAELNNHICTYVKEVVRKIYSISSVATMNHQQNNNNT